MNNPVIEWNGEITWATHQIEETKAGKVDPSPYSNQEWIKAMELRIESNKRLIEQQTGRPWRP